MQWITLALLVYLAGAGIGYYPGPLRVLSDVISRHENRRSDDDMTLDDDLDDDVMTRHDDAPDEPRATRVSARSLAGPRPLDELMSEAGITDEDDPADEDSLPDDRRVWVRRELQLGELTLTEIDAEGARLYGVSTRTIARDRETLAERARRGTVKRKR